MRILPNGRYDTLAAQFGRKPGKTLSRSLSDLKNRSEKEAERGQILTISPGNRLSIAQDSGEI